MAKTMLSGSRNAEYAVTIFGWRNRRNRANLPEEPLEDTGLLDDVTAHHLEHLVAAHELVVGEVNDPHATPAELADDPVIRMVTSPGGSMSGWSE